MTLAIPLPCRHSSPQDCPLCGRVDGNLTAEACVGAWLGIRHRQVIPPEAQGLSDCTMVSIDTFVSRPLSTARISEWAPKTAAGGARLTRQRRLT
jgi:hypothetical protein